MKTPSFQFSTTRGLSTLAVILIFLVTQTTLIFQTPALAAPLATVVTVGAGSYNTTLPAGRLPPSNSAGTAISPKRTASLTGPMPTNDWWSSLGFQRFAANPYSENMFAHPLAMHAKAGGLGIGYTTTPGVGASDFSYGYTEELTLGVVGLNSPDAKVDGFSDWTVTGYWASGANSLKATFGHGLPYVYATKTGADALITFSGTPTVWSNSGNAAGVTVNGHHYGLFAPAGATWTIAGTTAQSSLAAKDYYSVAVLPDNTVATLNDFKAHAFAFVTNTTVSWNYNAANAQLTTTFNATTTIKEGTEGRPLMALYRHQWLNSSDVNTTYTYVSARGQMKVVRGNTFTTTLTFNGVLPAMPDMGSYNRTTLATYINDIYNAGNYIPGGKDTYWTGKDLGRISMLVRIAEQVGNTAARDAFLNAMKVELQKWLAAPDGETANMFYYNSTWGTLIGYPAAYGSDTELNDHHFHYGYYILAAATIAQYDPTWASDPQWGGMVKVIINDVANISTATDSRFPRLRNFDPYEGHGWASGHAGFAAGNNQESSSEAMMFNTAVFLWGAATGNSTLRDLGIYLYTNETRAIEQYWFDVDNIVFPATYSHVAVGMVWGQGGAHGTWFSGEPEMIHGINFLPITSGSTYLGRNPAYVTTNYNEIVSENGGVENEWMDIIWSFQAFADPAAAVSKFGRGTYGPEAGETKAHTYHWIHNLNAMGQVDTTITANIPTYAVFNKGGVRTYAAYNPGSSAITVSYSNGTNCTVPANTLFASTNCSTGPTPTPTNTSPATNTPTNTPIGPTNTPTSTPTPTSTSTSCGATNVALGKPATASSVLGGNTAAMAVDGNAGTRWESVHAVDPQWIYVDLGSTQSICRVRLNWEPAYGKSYQIQTSNDATTWTNIYSTTTGDGGIDDLTGLSGSGRYVRMYGTVRATIYGYSLWEYEIYTGSGGPTATPTNTAIPPTNTPTNTPVGPTNTPTNTSVATNTPTNTPIPPTSTPTNTPSGGANLALNKPVTCSPTPQYPCAQAVDGNTGTRWASAQGIDPQWIYVDLGATHTLTSVTLRWEAAYATAFQIQTSNDAANWTNVYSTTTGTGGVQNLSVTGSGRYVRMYGTARVTQYGYSLWEFEVYGN
jgi:endoglucanase Acf2